MIENTQFDDYVFRLTLGDFDEKTQKEQAEEYQVNPGTIQQWRKKIDWDFVKSERRKRYASKTVEVDEAMYRMAKKGDVAAAKVWYERFDGWIPTSGTININDKKDDALTDRAAAILNQLASRAKPDSPGTSPASA